MAAKQNRKHVVSCLAVGLALLSARAAHAYGWHTTETRDQFTDVTVCRATPGTIWSRAMVTGLMQAYYASYFFVERRGNDVRAGVTNDRGLPEPFDVQVRVDHNDAVTITAADTPIDVAPTQPTTATLDLAPELKAQIDASTHMVYAASSPYRVVAGEKARSLLQQLLTGHEAKWRFLSVNAASARAIDIPIAGLKEALAKCGIDPTALEPPSR